MASATISSSSYSAFETNSNNVHDDSFSSYLALIRQRFSTELANPSSRRSSFQTIAPAKRTSMDENNELDVFAAEKYFSGGLDVQGYPELQASSNCSSSSSSKNKKRLTTKSRPSTCSDTSTHSHSILLGRRQQKQQLSTARRRRSFLDVFCCCCSKKNVVKDDADNSSGRSNSKLPPSSRRSPTAVLQSESSSELFEIESVSMASHPAVYEPSFEWSAATASAANFSVTSSSVRTDGKVRRRSSSGLLGFGCASEKAVSVTPDKDKVGALERYHVMMDLDSAGHVAARRASLG